MRRHEYSGLSTSLKWRQNSTTKAFASPAQLGSWAQLLVTKWHTDLKFGWELVNLVEIWHQPLCFLCKKRVWDIWDENWRFPHDYAENYVRFWSIFSAFESSNRAQTCIFCWKCLKTFFYIKNIHTNMGFSAISDPTATNLDRCAIWYA